MKKPSNLLSQLVGKSQAIPSSSKYRNDSPIDSLFAQGISLSQRRQTDKAIAIFRRILSADPRHFDAMTNLGTAYVQKGNHSEGIRLIKTSLRMNPAQPKALNNLGNALKELGRQQESLACYDAAINKNPKYADAYFNKGMTLLHMKQHSAALESFESALLIRPDYADALYRSAMTLRDLKRLDEAIRRFDKTLLMFPEFSPAYVGKGVVLQKLNRPEDALICFDQAIAKNSHYAPAYNNKGNALKDLKRFSEALLCFEQAIHLEPEYAEAHWNKALLLITLQNYKEGWKCYEWRWKKEAVRPFVRAFNKPLWLGKQDIRGKTVFLYSEQGLGDTIQFCRYAVLAEGLGAHIVLEVQKPLVGLIRTISPSISVIERGLALPSFDYQCPIMSLPLAFNTRVDSIPNQIPYLSVLEEKQKFWSNSFSKHEKIRVGLVWSGQSSHGNDHNRSIGLRNLKPILDLDAEFHCLQKDFREEDYQFMKTSSRITSWHTLISDFSDTAALISEMDIIISVDTSVAHLAGALGKRTWILLPFSGDYRWHAEGNKTPWYPTALLFRQPRQGDWVSVIQQVIVNLRTIISGANPLL